MDAGDGAWADVISQVAEHHAVHESRAHVVREEHLQSGLDVLQTHVRSLVVTSYSHPLLFGWFLVMSTPLLFLWTRGTLGLNQSDRLLWSSMEIAGNETSYPSHMQTHSLWKAP